MKKKYVRIPLLVAQILSLALFLYLAFRFNYVSRLFALIEDANNAEFFQWVTWGCLLEVPFALVGIAKSLRPYGHFRIATPIISLVFDGVLVYILLLGIEAVGGVSGLTDFGFVFIAGLFLAVALFILGIILGISENQSARFDRLVALQSANKHSPNAELLTSLDETVQPTATPISGKAGEELSKLKKLYEYKLISDNEYSAKRQKILDRYFSKK